MQEGKAKEKAKTCRTDYSIKRMEKKIRRNRTLRFAGLWLILLSLIAAGECGAADYTVAEIDSLVILSIQQSIVHDYAAAEDAALELIDRYPEFPGGYFFRAGVINSMITDYEDSYRLEDFFAYIDRAIEVSEAAIEKEPANPWNYFYLGGSKAYLAFYHLRKDNYFTSLKAGRSALKSLKKAVELDSALFDAYIGLGNYKYWLSQKTEFLKWLPFIPDRREEGIRELYLARDQGKYSWESASSALCWVLIKAKRWEEALEVVEGPLAKYPDSRFFLFIKGKALFDLQRHTEALEVYAHLLRQVRAGERNNYFNEIGVIQKLMECNFYTGKYPEALRWCEEGLALPLSDEMRKEKKHITDHLIRKKKKCEKRISEHK